MKALDAKHGKFDLVLCVGDFFGPPKDEDEPYTEDDEVVQLLEGKLEGRVRSVFPARLSYSQKGARCSPSRVLRNARRAPASRPCH